MGWKIAAFKIIFVDQREKEELNGKARIKTTNYKNIARVRDIIIIDSTASMTAIENLGSR